MEVSARHMIMEYLLKRKKYLQIPLISAKSAARCWGIHRTAILIRAFYLPSLFSPSFSVSTLEGNLSKSILYMAQTPEPAFLDGRTEILLAIIYASYHFFFALHRAEYLT